MSKSSAVLIYGTNLSGYRIAYALVKWDTRPLC
jgi:hypothetical protein